MMTSGCRILIIEDDDKQAKSVEKACKLEGSSVAIEIATNSRDAEHAIDSGEFDLIICDLALPRDERSNDVSTDEGMSLFGRARERLEGTPVFILSGHADLTMVQKFFSTSATDDLYGFGVDEPLVQFFPKENLLDCVSAIHAHIRKIELLDAISVRVDGTDDDLTLSERRAVRIAGRRLGASSAVVSPFTEGLSSSRPLRVSFGGGVSGETTVVVKIADLASIIREFENYNNIAPKIPRGLAAHVLSVVRSGTGSRGALVYQLADRNSISLFNLLIEDPDRAMKACKALRQALSPWIEGAQQKIKHLTEIRRNLISDQELYAAGGNDLEGRERDLEIATTVGMVHGDLHGFNVIVDGSETPVLIDFGDSGLGDLAIDPITLEMSALFHPQMKQKLGQWPTLDQASQWTNLDLYLVNCPVAEFVRECRAWAQDVSSSGDEVVANGYAFSVRQLKFDDTSPDLVRAMGTHALDVLSGQQT